MTRFLEQLQQSLSQLENRVKRIEQKLSRLEKATLQEKGEPELSEEFIETEIRVFEEKQKVLNWRKFEINIGKYLLQVVGVGVFLLGMGFFLKYSIEKEWLNPTLRFALGIVTATAAIGLGEYLKHYYKQWSLGCIAGGIVLYYLSFYAAYSIYGFFSLYQVFSAFMLTTIFAGLLALWHDSFFIALFSILGGFIMPLILRMHIGNPILLSGYLFVFSVGYLGLSYIKKWFTLSYLSLFFIIFYYGHPLVGALSYNQEISFLITTWIIFSLIPYICIFVYPIKKREFESILLGISTCFVALGFFYTLTSKLGGQSFFWQALGTIAVINHATIIKFIAVVNTIINSCMLIGLYYYRQKNLTLMSTLYTLSVFSSFVFIKTQWSGYSLIATLSVFSLFLFWLSFMVRHYLMRLYSYVMWGYCGWLLCINLLGHAAIQSLWFNEINMCLGLLVVVVSLAWWLSISYKKYLHNYESITPTIFEGVLFALPIYWMYTKVWKFPYTIIGLSCYGLIIFVIGLARRQIIMRQCAYVAGVFAISNFAFRYFFKNLLNPYWSLWLNVMCITFIVVFTAALVALHYFWKSYKTSREIITVRTILEMLLALSLFGWIRANIILYFDQLNIHGALFAKRLMGYTIKQDYLVRQPITNVFLTMFYAIYAVMVIFVGLFYQKKELRYFGLSIIVLALAKLWFIIMRMPETMHRIVAFLVVGLLLIGISFFYQKMSKKIT